MNKEMYDWAMGLLAEPSKWTRSELNNALDTLQECLDHKYGRDIIETLPPSADY